MWTNKMRLYLWACWSLIYIYGKRLMVDGADGRTGRTPSSNINEFRSKLSHLYPFTMTKITVPHGNSNALRNQLNIHGSLVNVLTKQKSLQFQQHHASHMQCTVAKANNKGFHSLCTRICTLMQLVCNFTLELFTENHRIHINIPTLRLFLCWCMFLLEFMFLNYLLERKFFSRE